ncbi:MAG: hypothetical protein ABJA82_14300, partial [Myxococcales bacterium]
MSISSTKPSSPPLPDPRSSSSEPLIRGQQHLPAAPAPTDHLAVLGRIRRTVFGKPRDLRDS